MLFQMCVTMEIIQIIFVSGLSLSHFYGGPFVTFSFHFPDVFFSLAYRSLDTLIEMTETDVKNVAQNSSL